jgi:PAS domain S-box-containing protein
MSLRSKYELLFKNAGDAVFTSAPDGNCTDINPAGVELFGYESREEMLGLNIKTDLFADTEEASRYAGRLKEHGAVRDRRIELKGKDGKRLAALSQAFAVTDEDGEVVGYQYILHDLSVEETLKEDLGRLTSAINTAEMGIWSWDIVNGRIDLDEQACRLFGLEPSTFRGTREEFYSTVHPEDRELVSSRLRRRIDLDDIRHKTEYRVIRPDGSVHYIAGRGQALRDEAGRVIKMQGISWDITEFKKTAKSLAESEERFRLMVQNSNDIIALLDEKAIPTFISGPMEKVLGYGASELIGASLQFATVHPDDKGNVRKVLADCMRSRGSVHTIEYRARHKNGKWVTLEAVGANLLHDPVVHGVVINLRDISERERLQEQLQQAMKMEAIGRLAGGIAHDFNNILTVISGNIELARLDVNLFDPLNHCLDQIMKATESASSLTRQLLAFSRKQIIEPRVLNLNDIVRNVRKMLARLIGENIELSVELAEDLGSVRIDAGQFEQVLINMAVNSRDAMPLGGRITIETANVTLDMAFCDSHTGINPGRFVMLAVTDTGFGMSKEVRQHIFEPFFTTKSNGHGTGLGLPTIFGIVQLAGGAIDCRSEQNEGATFRIYLPLIEAQAERLIRERRSIARLKGSETILLVEDESGVRNVAVMMLKDLGYRVIEAQNGEVALMLAERLPNRIDLLLTDVVMTGINGRELSERLTSLRPGLKTLFCSGYTENIIAHQGVVDADIHFIGKPYSMQALAGKIREVLGKNK